LKNAIPAELHSPLITAVSAVSDNLKVSGKICKQNNSLFELHAIEDPIVVVHDRSDIDSEKKREPRNAAEKTPIN